MAGVMPKIKTYLLISLFCLLINLCVFTVALIDTPTTDVNDFVGGDVYDIDRDRPSDEENVSMMNLGLATGSSFVPFFSIVSSLVNGEGLPAEVFIFTGIVLAIIGAYQVLLISAIILNYLPKILGSGWDV